MTQIAFKRLAWHARLVGIFDKLGPCGNVGLIIGMIAGSLLTLLAFQLAHLRPAPLEVFWIVVILSLFCWVTLIFIAIVFLRLQLRSVFYAMLMRSLVICMFTVLITHFLDAYRFGIIIGIFVGLFFGYILCELLKRVRG